MTGNIGARASRKGPRPKHVPLRTCVICRDKEAKREFVRIVRTPDDEVQIDSTGKRNGRGAYLCDNYRCWERAVTGTDLDRALKTEIDEAVRAVLSRYADEHFRKDVNTQH